MKLFAWCFVLVLCAWTSGCKTEQRTPGLGDDFATGTGMGCVDNDGDGFGPNCARGNDCDDTNATVTSGCYVCAHDEPGCPCKAEGARASCGKVTARVGDQTTCGYGESVCSNGTWGECLVDARSTRSFKIGRAPLGLAPATACTTNVCDPYCKQYPDTPDESLTTRTGIIGTDAGVTTELIEGGARYPNGPMPPEIKTQLVNAGLYPDAGADALIYHELTPVSTAQDNVATTVNLTAVDVYFMNFTTGHGATGARNFWHTLLINGGVIERVREAIPDSDMGVGRYEQYDRYGWNTSGHGTIVYENVLSVTRDLSKLIGALNGTYDIFWDAGHVKPMSWVDAIFAMSTTGGLRGSGGSYWVVPRSSWISPITGFDTGSCPAGRIGYPCFRRNALPISVLFTQSPANNGPGGQYAYARNTANGIYGASYWPAPTPVTNNWTEATARAIDPITQFASYNGTTTPGTPNKNWGWYSPPDCEFERGRASPNSFFKFRVNQRTWYHFDTFGSSFDTVLYLYTPAGEGIACNDHHFFGGTQIPIVSSLDGVLNPGDYFLVVDGQIGANGDYQLHVNAMPDGAAVSEPNYDEMITAYNAIGGKVVSVDASGYTCQHGPTAMDQRNTGNALEKLAIDTGSVNTAGVPFRVLIDNDLGICRSGDPALDTQLTQAITGLFNTVASSVMDVSMVAVDTDDAVDFDGPPGRPAPLTPINIDDATFVQGITTVALAETNANCQQTLPNRFVGCQPGTKVTFAVTFRRPGNVPVLGYNQIFTFVLRTLRNGTLVLRETPVVIVVPPTMPPYYADAWFVRDYDGNKGCPKGTAPYWSNFAWNAQTPGDSHIDFEIAVAPSVEELPLSPIDALLFTNPPGPMALAGQPIRAANPPGGPNTQFGEAMVDTTLTTNERPRASKAMRLRAHLVPSTDRTFSPLLQLWNQQISCQPAE